MVYAVRYTCHAALLPVIEGAFAANGYTLYMPPYTDPSGTTVLMLRREATMVLLTHLSNYSTGDIEIWGAGQRTAALLLESLPLEVQRQPALHAIDTDESGGNHGTHSDRR